MLLAVAQAKSITIANDIPDWVCVYAGTVKRHNPIIGSKHTTLSQRDNDLFGSKMHMLHNRMTSSLYQRIGHTSKS